MKLKSQTDNGYSTITDRSIVRFFSRYAGLIVVFELLLIFCISLFAQSNVWPEYLSLPDTTAPTAASTVPFHVKSTFLTSDILKNTNSITYIRDTNKYLFEQHLDYNVTNYLNGVQSHYAGLSGIYKRKSMFNSKGSLGVDWTPGLYYYKSKETGILQVPFDIGPILDYKLSSIPLSVRAGVSAYGWNDKFNRSSGFLDRDNYDAEPGYYGAITIGDSISRWFKLPVLIQVDVLGKEIGGTGLGVIKSSLKTALGLQSGDSIFFNVGDSLSNGKELYNAGSSTLYSTTPWKIEHNFMVTGALRGKERKFLRPGILYTFTLRDITYPVMSSLLDDTRVTGSTLGFQLLSGENHRISYSGGLSLNWNTTDRIYKETLQQINADPVKQSVNLGDCDEYLASTDHELTFHLPSDIALNYQLHCTRNSKSYPYMYVVSSESKSNENEGDRIRNLHHAAILYTKDSVLALEMYGEFAKNYMYYYRKARSGESMSSDYYKVGMSADWIYNNVRVTEFLFATAEKSDYKFKSVHKGDNFDPPPYSRRLSSALSIVWALNSMWTITGKWNETYFDNGKWYGNEYFDRLSQSDSIYNLYHGTYGIENKSIDYSLQLIVSCTIERWMLSAGFLFRDNNFEEYIFSESRFKPRNTGEGYISEPSLETMYHFNTGQIKFKVSRKINTDDPDKSRLSKNWNLGLGVNFEF